MKRNQLAIIIPCHRVVAISGKIGGWNGPVGLKEWFLNMEAEKTPGLFGPKQG